MQEEMEAEKKKGFENLRIFLFVINLILMVNGTCLLFYSPTFLIARIFILSSYSHYTSNIINNYIDNAH